MSSDHDEASGSDDGWNDEINESASSKRYPVHDACEFEDLESLRRLIFVPQESDDDSSSASSSSSSDTSDDDSGSSSDEDDTQAAKAAALGHSPADASAAKSAADAESQNKASGAQPMDVDGGEDQDKEQDTNKASSPLELDKDHGGSDQQEQDKEQEEKKQISDLKDERTPVGSQEGTSQAPKDAGGPSTAIADESPEKQKDCDASSDKDAAASDHAIQRDNGDSQNDQCKRTVETSSITVEAVSATVSSTSATETTTQSVTVVGIQASTETPVTSEQTGSAAMQISPEEQHTKPHDTEEGEGKEAPKDEQPEVAASESTDAKQSASSQGVRHEAAKKKKKKQKQPKEPKYYCPFDIDERDEDENTPLHIAIHFRKLEHVRLLLEAGASVHRKCDGSSPIHTAISIGSIQAHAEFSYDCVELLHKYGADLDVKDDSMHTPLYLACTSNLPRVVSYLLGDASGMTTLNLRADRVGGRALHAAAKFDVVPRGAGRSRSGSVGRSHHHAHGPHGGVLHRGHHHHPGLHRVQSAPARPDNGESSSDILSPEQKKPAAASVAIVTELLLSTSGIEIDPLNTYGRTPLHVAAMRGNWTVARLLLNSGASAHISDRRGFTPGQLARKRGMVIPNDLLPVLLGGEQPVSSSDVPSRDLIMDPDSSTIILCHELCSRHYSCPPIIRGDGSQHIDPPPENVRRLNVLINQESGILRCAEFSQCSWENETRRAAMVDILKVHEYTYVERISAASCGIADDPNAIAHLDADTAISRWSFEAAMRAAGSVCEAVDKVMAGDFRNAFCAVRPPGHHAGPRGIVTCPNDPDGSHGFCLLNNVAIGAAYARSMYRNDGIQKVAIIDFDVHHGNGTEEIVRQLLPTVEHSLIRTPFAVGAIETSRYRPWLDENDVQDVFFASTHGYGPRELRFADHVQPHQGGWFYPASGESSTSDAIKNPSSVENPNLGDFILSQTWTRMGEEARTNCCKIINVGLDLPRPSDVPGMQRLELRDSYRKKVLPHLLDFDPDMIFISAGFDAHKKDTMNFGYVGMIEDDYEWVTEQLVKIANTCCNGRIVSVLEGGYKIHGGIVSPFARSVASHVRALVDGGNSRESYDKHEAEWESQFERHMIEEKEKKRQMKIERLNRAAEIQRRLIEQSTRQHHVGAEERRHHGEDHHDMDAIMKEPLADHGGDDHRMHSDSVSALKDVLNEASGHHGREEEDGERPSRKRRRPAIDYKELYEQMKKEGAL